MGDGNCFKSLFNNNGTDYTYMLFLIE